MATAGMRKNILRLGMLTALVIFFSTPLLLRRPARPVAPKTEERPMAVREVSSADFKKLQQAKPRPVACKPMDTTTCADSEETIRCMARAEKGLMLLSALSDAANTNAKRVRPTNAQVCSPNPESRLKLQRHVEWEAGSRKKDCFWKHVELKDVPPFWMRLHDPNSDQFISKSIMDGGAWDAPIFSAVVTILKAEKAAGHQLSFVDAGTNIGFFSLVAASMGATVVSFEPMSHNLLRYLSSVVKNGFHDRVTVYQNALSFEHRKISMEPTHHTNIGNGYMHLDANPNGAFGDKMMVTITMDEVVDMDVSMMKVDVEEFETQVWGGMTRVLCDHIVRHIVVEVNQYWRQSIGNHDVTEKNDGKCRPYKALEFMVGLGYAMHSLMHERPLEMKDAVNEGNLLFRLKDTSRSPSKRAAGGDVVAQQLCGM